MINKIGTAPLGAKISFWLLTLVITMFLAEVSNGSSTYIFHPWVVLVVAPLYFLHSLFLISLIFRFGKPTFAILLTAGIIYSLYEAFITKVLWNPPWPGAEMWPIILGFNFFALFILLFWHTFFAFIIPLLISETYFTRSKNLLEVMPKKIKKLIQKKPFRFLTLITIIMIIFNMISVPFPLSFISAISIIIVLYLSIKYAMKKETKKYTFMELLPGKIGFMIISILLAIYYIITYYVLEFEKLPSLNDQILLIIIYIILFVILLILLRKSNNNNPEIISLPDEFKISKTKLIILAVSYIILATILFGNPVGILTSFFLSLIIIPVCLFIIIKNLF